MKRKAINYIRDEPKYMEIHIWKGYERFWRNILIVILLLFLTGGFIVPIILFILELNQEDFINWSLYRLFLTPILLYLLYKANDILSYPFIIVLDAENAVVKCSGDFLRKKLYSNPLSSVKSCTFSNYVNKSWTELLKKPNDIDKIIIAFHHSWGGVTGVREIESATNKEMYELYDRIGKFFQRNNYIISI